MAEQISDWHTEREDYDYRYHWVENGEWRVEYRDKEELAESNTAKGVGIMTEEELVEKITNEIFESGNDDDNPIASINKLANQIMSLIKKAGYKSPEEARDLTVWSIDETREIDRKVWAKANGYVKLAEDQSIPENPFDSKVSGLCESAHNGFEFAKLKYRNWRNVKL